jgi:hypothetical protein
MANFSLIRSVATASIASGFAVLCWYNNLGSSQKEQAEQTARDYGQRLLDKAREWFDGDGPPGPTPLPM